MLYALKSLCAWLARAMGDGDSPSTSRLIVVSTVPVTILLPLFVWAALSVRASALVEFPPSITGFITAAVTLILGAFHLNKREESR
jgi:hypothetical protein